MPEIPTKRCPKCGETKPITAFTKLANSKRDGYCHPCRNQASVECYQQNYKDKKKRPLWVPPPPKSRTCILCGCVVMLSYPGYCYRCRINLGLEVPRVNEVDRPECEDTIAVYAERYEAGQYIFTGEPLSAADAKSLHDELNNLL